MSDVFWCQGLHFSCKRCSGCCRFDPGFVFLSEADLTRLLEWSHMSRNAFILTYCRFVKKPDGYAYLCLKEQSNYDCILWDNGCQAYEWRPLQCSSFPFWASLLADKDWWDAQAEHCPGMNSGKWHSADEIVKLLKKKSSEPPIRERYQEEY